LSNLAPILKKDPIIDTIGVEASRLGAVVYLVGGYPRDLLMGMKTVDYDLVTFSKVKPLARGISRSLGGLSLIFSPFETAKITLNDGRVIDIARARREYYPKPGALPKVEPTDNLIEDLERRDFTINAMAISLNREDFGHLYDPFRGEEDIKNKIIRVIKRGSFSEDPTRALRAIRYKNRFSFRYSEEMEMEFEGAKRFLKDVSFERVRNELERISSEKTGLKCLSKLRK